MSAVLNQEVKAPQIERNPPLAITVIRNQIDSANALRVFLFEVNAKETIAPNSTGYTRKQIARAVSRVSKAIEKLEKKASRSRKGRGSY